MIYFACSLPLFNGNAVSRLKSAFELGMVHMIVGTDAKYNGENFEIDNPWYREVSVAKYFARVIYNTFHKKSITKLLE